MIFQLLTFIFLSAGGSALVVEKIPSWPLPLQFGGRAFSSATAGLFLSLADAPSPSPAEFWPFLLCVLFIVMILGGLFWAWNQGKEALGRKPTSDDRIAAMQQKIEEELVTHESLNLRLHGVATKVELQAAELRIEHALSEQFKSLDEKRSISIAGLHRRIEEQGDKLREAISESTAGRSRR